MKHKRRRRRRRFTIPWDKIKITNPVTDCGATPKPDGAPPSACPFAGAVSGAPLPGIAGAGMKASGTPGVCPFASTVASAMPKMSGNKKKKAKGGGGGGNAPKA